MSSQAREEILGRLKSAKRNQLPPRPARPGLSEVTLDREQMLQRFTAELTFQTGSVYKAQSPGDTLRILSEIRAAERFRSVIVTGNDMHGVDIRAFSEANNITVSTPNDLLDREALREAAFTADAGITFADFAIAETGTVGIVFNKRQPRLASIAPPVHIAIIPIERLYPIYEDAIEKVFGSADDIPSQFSFITGPSATSDIQAIQFKGMHGPMKVIVIFIMGQG
jgi:L-lactate dehydrogenase complex protein LldG